MYVKRDGKGEVVQVSKEATDECKEYLAPRASKLAAFFKAEQDGDDTVLHIDTSGSIGAGGGNADQRITLEDFTTGETDSSAILAQMLNDDQLKIDQ